MLRQIASFLAIRKFMDSIALKVYLPDWGEMLPMGHFCLEEVPQFDELILNYALVFLKNTFLEEI